MIKIADIKIEFYVFRIYRSSSFMNPMHMDTPVLANQQELIYTSSVQTQDVNWKTWQE